MGTGESPIAGFLAARRRVLKVALGALVAALTLSACGTSSSPPSPSAPATSLLGTSEIERYPANSVERAFLEYWSNLQYRSWADVAAYYHPRFRDFIGTTALIGAKKISASTYPLLIPKVERVNPEGGDTTIFYTLMLPDGTKELDSITWRKDEGAWQIIYDSRLDAELGQQATSQAEVRKGTPETDATSAPSPEAVRAGKDAEQKQARFLAEELKVNAP